MLNVRSVQEKKTWGVFLRAKGRVERRRETMVVVILVDMFVGDCCVGFV